MSINLGLDLGPNSIGWALVDDCFHRIVAAGVRIFPEGVDNFDSAKEASRNETRRIARGMRRQIRRRSMRKKILRQALIEAGLWPKDTAAQRALESQDPYALRARAIDVNQPKLTKHELGRLLLHLNRRRGFLSNRKEKKADKEAQGMKAEIGTLAHELEQRNQTLGQYLYEKTLIPHDQRQPEDRIRRRHTARAMFEQELLAIAARHSDILTDKLLFGRHGRQPLQGRKPLRCMKGESLLQAAGLHGIIFFQRALYWPKSMIGLCELEPKEKRCPRFDRRAQRFRLLQEVNNLRYINDATHQEEFLKPEARTLLLDKLAKTEKLEFEKIADLLSKLPGMPAREQIKFNYQRGERAYLKGHITDARVAKAYKKWHELPEETKDQAVAILLDPSLGEDEVRRHLTESLGFKPDAAQALMEVDLPDGYIDLSLRALSQGREGKGLLYFMEQGMKYQAGKGTVDNGQPTDAIHAAGYLRSDELLRRALDHLPAPEKLKDTKIGDIPNPVVKRTLTELRKLVNAIIREYGKPDAIHIEMARNLKEGEKKRKAYSKHIAEIEKRRKEAAEEIEKFVKKSSRDDVTKYLLWLEQDRICVYSGRSISITQLFNGDTDVDHILPYSRCLDNSQMNKVLCFRDENALKGQQTPYQWLAHANPTKYEQVCQRAKKLPYPKYKRFLQKEVELDSFIARQLVDTAYIARATAQYLSCLFDQKTQGVLGLKGQLTAELRYQWGLHNLLTPEADEKVKVREDHRHHAIDAIVIALTNRSRLQGLSRIRKQGGTHATGEVLPEPWPTFRQDVQAYVNQIQVSHRPSRKVAGGLHEETMYGLHRNDAGQTVANEYVVRKPLEALSANEIPSIRDVAVRDAVIRRLAEHGYEIGRGKTIAAQDMKVLFGDPANPLRLIGKKTGTQGPPIRKVRVIKKEQTIRPIRSGDQTVYVKPGSTHHLSFFEYQEEGKTKYEAVWTTMLDAADRLKRQTHALSQVRQKLEAQGKGKKIRKNDPRLIQAMQQIARDIPLITRVHPQSPEAKFLFSLSRGEMVLAQVGGKPQLLVYNTSASTAGQMWFYHHTDARPAKDKKKFSFMVNTLLGKAQARKVSIDYLGRVRWARD